MALDNWLKQTQGANIMAFTVVYRTLDTTEASNEQVVLAANPSSPTQVAMDLIGGTAQSLNGDFGVSDSTVRWDSTAYNLNGMLLLGDKIRIIYDCS